MSAGGAGEHGSDSVLGDTATACVEELRLAAIEVFRRELPPDWRLDAEEVSERLNGQLIHYELYPVTAGTAPDVGYDRAKDDLRMRAEEDLTVRGPPACERCRDPVDPETVAGWQTTWPAGRSVRVTDGAGTLLGSFEVLLDGPVPEDIVLALTGWGEPFELAGWLRFRLRPLGFVVCAKCATPR